MRIKKLIIENYKSFRKRTEIDFNNGLRSEKRNIFLIGGMNGSGKTSIMEALSFCLYGAKKEQIFKSINHLEMTNNNFSTLFELTIENEENKEIIIRRYWSLKNINSKPRAENLEENLLIIENGKEIYNLDQKAWQEFLDITIPKCVTQFFFFDGEKIQEMAADEHSETKLKSSLEAALGIELVRRLIEDIKHIINEERGTRTNITDKEIKLKEDEINMLKEKMEINRKERENTKKIIDEFEKKISDNKKRFSEIFGFEPEREKERKNLEKEKNQYLFRLSEIDREIKKIVETDLPILILNVFFNDMINQINIEDDYKKNKIFLDNLEKVSETIVDNITNPTTICCKKVIQKSDQILIKNKIKEAVKKLISVSEDKSYDQELLQLSQTDKAKIISKIDESKNFNTTYFINLIEEKREINQKIKEIDKKIADITIPESDKEKFEELQSEIESYATQVGRKKEELQKYDIDCNDLTEKIENKKREIDILYKKHSEDKKKEILINNCNLLVEVLIKYCDKLRESKISELQEKTFDMYRRLASKADLISKVEIDPLTYSITIKDKQENHILKQNLSAGEKEVFAISLLWGLAQTSQLNLPVIIDTPLSRLDSMHRDNIIRKYFPEAGKQVIILSTDTEVDKSYYKLIEPYLQHTIKLHFDISEQSTIIKEGYFWE